MDSNTIGQAAAVEALKMSAQQGQNQGHQGHAGGTPHPSAAGAKPQDKLVRVPTHFRFENG
jgi:hypothetical protein